MNLPYPARALPFIITLVTVVPFASARTIDASTISCGGTEVYSTMEVSQGQSILLFKLTGGIRATPETSPLHLMNQMCHVSASTVASNRGASGNCIWLDKDGDKLVFKFTRSAPNPGTTEITAGTGKFAGAKGSGTYQVIPLPPVPGSMNSCVEGRWNIELPN